MKVEPNKQPESDLPNGIGKPAERALANAGYLRLEQFTQVSTGELLKLGGVRNPRLKSVEGTGVTHVGFRVVK